jgi:Family of unknown function (DUF6527)
LWLLNLIGRNCQRGNELSRIDILHPQFVEFIPERLESGVLYISKRFKTASHLCCCGCGKEVATPLNPSKWRLNEHGTYVSLSPSIGNWSFQCRSHYWVEENRVQWASAMSAARVTAVKARDKKDAEIYSQRFNEAPRIKQGAFIKYVEKAKCAFKKWFGQ